MLYLEKDSFFIIQALPTQYCLLSISFATTPTFNVKFLELGYFLELRPIDETRLHLLLFQ